ncbi:MAG: sulfurtransferase TusA family protein [Acidiferrobacterales bacterium]
MNTMSLDCSGLNCPLPILRLSKAINGVGNGDRVELIATDPGSIKDVQAWAKQTGNTLIDSRQSADRYTFLVAKGKP